MLIESAMKCDAIKYRAEWEALSEPIKEIMLMTQLLRSMKIFFEFQVMVRVHNVGTIIIASHVFTVSCTTYVDIRYK